MSLGSRFGRDQFPVLRKSAWRQNSNQSFLFEQCVLRSQMTSISNERSHSFQMTSESLLYTFLAHVWSLREVARSILWASPRGRSLYQPRWRKAHQSEHQTTFLVFYFFFPAINAPPTLKPLGLIPHDLGAWILSKAFFREGGHLLWRWCTLRHACWFRH